MHIEPMTGETVGERHRCPKPAVGDASGQNLETAARSVCTLSVTVFYRGSPTSPGRQCRRNLDPLDGRTCLRKPAAERLGAADNTHRVLRGADGIRHEHCLSYLEVQGAAMKVRRLTTKLSDGAPTARPASGRSALAQKVMVRARAPALYGSRYEHFMCPAVRCSAELGGTALVTGSSSFVRQSRRQ